uniref:Uncharacterized protein n=1 Tax=Myotis myotis TaxID=51298 RepID=A0A7J7V3W1_MYOMY|nr:hypothetical protein mMyoMyo1_008511 [Myotis myotis]
MGATPVFKKPAESFLQEGELSNVLRTRCSGPRGNAVARRCSRREGGRESPGQGSGRSLRDSRCQPLPARLRPGGGCPPPHPHTHSPDGSSLDPTPPPPSTGARQGHAGRDSPQPAPAQQWLSGDGVALLAPGDDAVHLRRESPSRKEAVPRPCRGAACVLLPRCPGSRLRFLTVAAQWSHSVSPRA